VGSLFAGIGGFDLGLERAGMRVIWQSEIDPYASAVLRKHWPHVPNHGDIRTITADRVERPDVLCGGFPCQDISNAGKRAGSTANDQDYGASTPELLASFDRATSSWRTSQLCLDGGLSEFSETWSRSGLMRSGIAYRLPTLVPLTDATDSGSWPTIRASDADRGGRGDLLAVVRTGKVSGRKHWPTPRANDAEKRGNFDATNPRNGLPGAARLIPTPTSSRWSQVCSPTGATTCLGR
jgi:hypothetical protein